MCFDIIIKITDRKNPIQRSEYGDKFICNQLIVSALH